jgi:hypothetical protein
VKPDDRGGERIGDRKDEDDERRTDVDAGKWLDVRARRVRRDDAWARVVGITLASVSALANFFFIPYQPVWAILMITLDTLVIAALCAPVSRDPRIGA